MFRDITDYQHYQDTGSQLRRLQDSQYHPIYWLQITIPISATYYPLTRLLTQSSTLFVLLSPHSSYIYRGSRATFTIKLLGQFHTLQKLTRDLEEEATAEWKLYSLI